MSIFRHYLPSFTSLVLPLVLGLSACNGRGLEVHAQDLVSGPQAVVPAGSVDPAKGNGACRGGGDPKHICLAMKYVSFKDASNDPAILESDARDTIRKINQLWSQCNLSFQIERYVAVTHSLS